MKTSLEERVSELEKRVEDLARAVAKRPTEIKDWRLAMGMMEDTPEAREADRLGAEWRRAQVDP